MHVPVRPVWTCAACGRPWPCPSRQRQLLAEYADARVSLSVFLSACFVQACADLAAMPAGVLYRRSQVSTLGRIVAVVGVGFRVAVEGVAHGFDGGALHAEPDV